MSGMIDPVVDRQQAALAADAANMFRREPAIVTEQSGQSGSRTKKRAGKSKPSESGGKGGGGGGEPDMTAKQIAADRAKYESRPLDMAETDYLTYKGSVAPGLSDTDARARELQMLLRKRYEDAKAAGKTRF